MRHARGYRRLNRTHEHRKALFSNMAGSLIEHEQIKTTLPKAKTVQPFIEKLISAAKKGDLASRRRVISKLGGDKWHIPEEDAEGVERNKYGELKTAPRITKHLFDNVAPRFADRTGGYTRIIKLGKHRIGDGADLVVLGAPVGSMPRIVQEAAPHLSEGALVTDVGSVKAALCESLPGLLPPGVTYVGAHPMAGSHHRGVGHARADLFEGACCVLTPLPETPPAARERVAGFWRALGARVAVRSPAEHDAQVAWMSHVPHVLAFAFGEALSQAPPGAEELAGSGFRDFTRIARSDAELWGEILSANRKALARPIQAFRDALTRLVQAIEDGDGDRLEEGLAAARQALAGVEVPECGAPHGAVDDASNRPIRGRDPGNSGGPGRSASPKKVTNDS